MKILKAIFDGVRVMQNSAVVSTSDEFIKGQRNEFEKLRDDAKLQVGVFEHRYGSEPLEENKQNQLAAFEAVNTPGHLIGKFEDMLNNPHVVEAFDKLTSQMEEEGRFNHPRFITASFRVIAAHLPQEDIVDMAKLIAKDRVFRSSVKGSMGTKGETLDEIGSMTKNAPADMKLMLFSALEQDGFLEEMLDGVSSPKVAYFLKNMFEGVEMNSVNATLSTSNVLDHVIPSSQLRKFLTEYDARLVGAVFQYAKGKPKPMETGQDHDDVRL